MSEKKSETKPVTRTLHSKSALGVEGKFNWKLAFIVVLPLVLIGAYVVIRSLAATTPPLAVKVQGDHFVDQNGATLQLRGVNYSGTEYACVAGGDNQGYTTDPTLHGTGQLKEGNTLAYGTTMAQNFLKWDKAGAGGHAINTVRIPLNEGCWLGTNGTVSVGTNCLDGSTPANRVPCTGANYQTFIKKLVDQLTAQGMYVVLDNHWSGFTKDANGVAINQPSNSQNVGPTDNAPAFWKSVATTYKSYGNVMFDLFNEPGIGCPGIAGCSSPNTYPADPYQAAAWNVYVNGGNYTYAAGNNGARASDVGKTVKTPGLQTIVSDSIRSATTGAGANNPVIVEALGWGSGYLEQMGLHLPIDPLASTSTGSQVAASFHDYKTALPSDDWDGSLSQSLKGRYPIYVGEYSRAVDCTANATWANNTFAWLDKNNYSSTGWAWDSNRTCLGVALVTDPSGNDTGETTPMGALVKSYLQSRQSGTPTPPPPPPPPPVDNISPTVTLSVPSTTVVGTVSLTATAGDNIGIKNVDFKVDNTLLVSDTSSPYGYSWNSTGIVNGSHTLTATAYDDAGNSTISSVVVTVNNPAPPIDNVKPTISLTAPASGTVLTGNTTSLTATASDNVAVTRVDFKVDSSLLGSDTTAPYVFNWNSSTVGNGTHTLSATAYDAAGNSQVSTESVTVSVSTNTVDTLSPQGQTAAPTTNAILSGTVTISGTADGTGSAVGAVKVCAGCSSDTIAANASTVRSGNTATWSYTLDTTKVSNGPTSIITWIDDAAGNKGGVAVPVTIQNGDMTPPTPATGLSATAQSATSVRLSWTAATDNVGIAGYYVVRDGVTIAQVGNTTSYTDSTVSAATSYNYQLIAFDLKGNNSVLSTASRVTTPTAPDTYPPSTPANVKVTAVSTSQINISWSASTDTGGSGLRGYDVYRNGAKVVTIPASATSFGDTGLNQATSYDYYVKAVDGAGNASNSSAIVTASTLVVVSKDIMPPVWPNGSTLTLKPITYNYNIGPCNASTGCTQNISWSKATDNTGVYRYNVLRKTDGGSNSLIAVLSATQLTFADKTVSGGHTYTYQIFARDLAGNRTAGPVATKSINCYIIFCQ